MGFRRAGGLVFAWRAGVVPHRPLVLVSSSWAPRPAGFFARGRRGIGARKPAGPCFSVSFAPSPVGFFARGRFGIGARKPAGPCFSVSFAPSPRAQTKSDARRLPPSCITFPPLYFQKERIDDEDSRPPFVVNSNHLLVPLALICIRHHKKLTTASRFRKVCRQSNSFHILFTLIQFGPNPEIASSDPDFLLSSPYLTISPGHSTLIYPAAAGKLTTERLEPRFRRQFLPISRKRPELEAARGRPCWRRPSCEALFFRQVAPTPPGFSRAVAGHVGAVLPAKP